MQTVGKMKFVLTIILMFSSTVLFSQNDTLNKSPSKRTYRGNYKLNLLKSDTVWNNMSLNRKWKFVVDSIGGCLTGGQYCTNNQCGDYSCCLKRDPYWESFLMKANSELISLLISKLSIKAPTKVHTCPYNLASEGELATYCLQHIFKVNWYDLDSSYIDYGKGNFAPNLSLQDVLQKKLSDKKELMKMKKQWTVLLNKGLQEIKD